MGSTVCHAGYVEIELLMTICLTCGRGVPEGAELCPVCGTAIPGAAKKAATGRPKCPRPDSSLKGALTAERCDVQNGAYSAPGPLPSQGNSGRRLVFEGTVYKCPNCGEVLGSFSSFCPSCGYELRGVRNTSSVGDFAARLERMHANRLPQKKKRGLLTSLLQIPDLTDEEEREVSLIRNYSVPNTKEDVLEFVILASTNIDPVAFDEAKGSATSAAEKAIAKAWVAKLEQVYQKAKLTFGNDPDFEVVHRIYDEAIKKVKWAQGSTVRWLAFGFGAPALAVLFCLIMSLVSGE